MVVSNRIRFFLFLSLIGTKIECLSDVFSESNSKVVRVTYTIVMFSWTAPWLAAKMLYDNPAILAKWYNRPGTYFSSR